jgi:CBS domain-containing membrane protein
MRRKDLLIAPICEGVLILVAALAGWITHRPLIFASLGPTAYELIETPKYPSARPYNIVVGHVVALLAAFASLYLTHAWAAPVVSAAGVPLPRVWAAALAAALTVFVTLLLRAAQPAAIATALLISLGFMQTWQDALTIFAAVMLMLVLGEPLRLWRLRNMPSD